MALSYFLSAATWFWCGTTRNEYTSLPKAAHCLNKVRATWGSGSSPKAAKSSTALLTLSCVWLLQNSSEPMGPPSSSKLPLFLNVISLGNKLWSIDALLPAAGITSHLELLNCRPMREAASLKAWKAPATSCCSPARFKSSR